MRDQILNNIITINKKEITNRELKNIEDKWLVYINNEQIKKNIPYTYEYKCVICKTIHILGSSQLLRKIRHNSIHCIVCRNEKQEEKLDIFEIHNKSVNDFNNKDSSFKDNYYLLHLTGEEYERISKNIISFCNGKLKDICNYEYWDIYKTNNKLGYSSVMYDKINNTIFKINQPILKCDKCNNNKRVTSLLKYRNCIKIYCDDCNMKKPNKSIERLNKI